MLSLCMGLEDDVICLAVSATITHRIAAAVERSRSRWLRQSHCCVDTSVLGQGSGRFKFEHYFGKRDLLGRISQGKGLGISSIS